jgi:hypothetical protein
VLLTGDLDLLRIRAIIRHRAASPDDFVLRAD